MPSIKRLQYGSEKHPWNPVHAAIGAAPLPIAHDRDGQVGPRSLPRSQVLAGTVAAGSAHAGERTRNQRSVVSASVTTASNIRDATGERGFVGKKNS